MKAKKKKIDKVTPKDLGVDISPRIEVSHLLNKPLNDIFSHLTSLQILSVVDPPVRQAGALVSDVGELLSKLKEKGFAK